MKIFTATLIIAGYMIIGPYLGAIIVALLANWLTPGGTLSIISDGMYNLRPQEGYLMFAYIFGMLPAVVGGYCIASSATENRPFSLSVAYTSVVTATFLNPLFLFMPFLLVLAPWILVAALLAFTILQYPTRKILELTGYKLHPQPTPVEA